MNSTWYTVGDVMTHAVVAVGRDADFREIAETLQQWQVSAVPVLAGDGRVIGVVSEADLLTAQDREPETYRGMTAGAMMTAPAVTVHPDSPIAEAGRSMARMHLKRLPVVDAEDCLVGIVSRGDLLKVHLREDGELAGQVRFELIAALHPADASGLHVTAEEGRITLSGTLPDKATAALLEHLVKGVPGVVDAEVRLGVPA
ncbi:CBS domain-containing protein [Kitasatospora sp. DSM 101779]|uniref:CBS domain-containing protein n=1 Tax=Kitasatospora sp. DSM 101779 TaxID=2853165 RepID=UPI0021D80773|nr:CBS domain-containing protein [Kitasatospora sp. DSM 101779]MCU7826481.1 CBS domain-containing protein [Kitasatospora sp. DSM 101779]